MISGAAISELPIAALPDALLTGSESITARYASHTFATRSTDTPAHANIQGRITKGVRLAREIEIGGDGAFGSLIRTTFGAIELNNADGALDGLVDDFTADGRDVRLYIGATEILTGGRQRVQAFADFELVYTTVAGSWSLEHDSLKLRIRDLGASLRSRLQSQTYSGAGGAAGPAELAGRTMPTAFAYCKNVTAQLVDPTNFMYQVHSGSIQAITAVYDMGIEVPFDTDYASYAALDGATIPAGEYATCLATGHLRLGGSGPLGNVTVDLQGDKDNISGNVVTTHANVIRMILRDYGGIPSASIDHDSFNTVTALAPTAQMGLFLPAGDQSTVEDVIARIALSNGCVVGQDRSGLYRIFRLDPPAASQHWSFNDRDIVRIDREEPGYSIPWRSWSIGYDANWTIQDAGELAGGVTTTRRLFLETERRYAFVQSPTIALAHNTSKDALPRDSLYRDQDDAEEEAERLLGLYARGRALYRFVVKNALFSVDLGQTVRLTYPRWNLANGRHFVVIAVADDADAIETELLVFG